MCDDNQEEETEIARHMPSVHVLSKPFKVSRLDLPEKWRCKGKELHDLHRIYARERLNIAVD
jgi:hypothetical protein